MKQPRYSKHQVLKGSNVSVFSENENGKLKIDVMIQKNTEDNGELMLAELVKVQAFNRSMEAIQLEPIAPGREHLIHTRMAGATISHCILLADSDIDELECVDVDFQGEKGRFFLEAIEKKPQDPR